MTSLPVGFRHDMFLYRTEDDFVRGTLAFVDEALRDGAPVLAMVSEKRAETLHAALGADARKVRFAPMKAVGRNPARIIPAWRAFVDAHGNRPLRGIGEPVWPGQTPAEIDEAQRHEQLLNLALADAADLWLLCPYDAAGLADHAIDHARRTHPHPRRTPLPDRHPTGLAAGAPDPYDYREVAFGGRLSDPPATAEMFEVVPVRLHAMRLLVGRRAAEMRLDDARAFNLVLSVDEAACNSIRYGGGSGTLRIWNEGPTLVCEMRDRGRLSDPLTGRIRPENPRPGRRGLWLANQLCDLVQLRSGAEGTSVRLFMGPD